MKKSIKIALLGISLCFFNINHLTVEATENVLELESSTSIKDNIELNISLDSTEQKKDEIEVKDAGVADVNDNSENMEQAVSPYEENNQSNISSSDNNENEQNNSEVKSEKIDTQHDENNNFETNSISTFNLEPTSHGKSVLHATKVDYYGQVKPDNDGIYTRPKGSGNSILYTSYLYNWKDIRVIEESTTNYGVYVLLVDVSSNKQIGWINKNDLYLYDTITAINSVEYYGQVKPNNSGIYTNPKGTYNSILFTTYKYNWENVKVVEESTTQQGIFSKLVDLDTEKVLGWMKKTDLYLYDSIIDTKQISYYGQVKPNNNGIYTNPKGTYNSILFTSYRYNWGNVRVIEESTTQQGVFSKLVDIDSEKVLGWILKSDLYLYNNIESRNKVSYYGIISETNTGIYTHPKGTLGSILYTSYLHNSQAVRVVEEAYTTNGKFIKLKSLDGKKELGWINVGDITVHDSTYLSRNSVQKFARINSQNTGIYTAPYIDFDSILYTSYLYNNHVVKVVEEVSTLGGSFSKLERMEDNSSIGWIRTDDVTDTNFVKNSKALNIQGQVKQNNKGIYTRPYGDFNSILYTSYLHNGENVRIIEEADTLTGHYYKIGNIYNGSVLGWIKSEDIKIDHDLPVGTLVNKYGIVKAKNNGIYTKPKTVEGAILYTSYLMNYKDVKIVEQLKIDNISYLRLADVKNEDFIGWIQESDINFYNHIIKTKSKNYTAKVKGNNSGIYTSPKGLYGSILYTSYLFNNKEVKVIEEADTDDGIFSKIVRVEDESLIGWIKKDDLYTKRVVFIDPGHGGSDPGASYFGVNEKDLNLKIALKLRNSLINSGFEVIMSRTTDSHVDFSLERSRMANASGADIFISLHNNAMPGNSKVNGIETFWYQYNSNYPSKINKDKHNDPDRLLKSSALATDIHKALIKETGAYDRGVKRNTFAVLRETAVPSVLLEFGYMSNPGELSKLQTSAYQNKLVKAVTDGVTSYFLKY